MSRVLIIAEAGVNHNGSIDQAMALVDAAADAGADVVKFQTFRAEAVVSKVAPKAEYQQRNTGSDESQLEMIKKLELAAEAHRPLQERAHARGIEFLSTPFDVPSVDLLFELGVKRLKVPSGEITNPILLRRVAATDLPLIVSSGMATIGEVEATLGVLAAAWLERRRGGGRVRPDEALRDDEAWALLEARVTLLHCTTEYPAPYDSVNLAAMATMRAAFGLPVGYSDHTQGTAIAIAAAALGATVLEKHFTLDKNLPGPDHKASLEPHELKALVEGVRAVERAIGDGRKRPTRAEAKNIPIARRSLVAARAIRKGEPFTDENLTTKRPATGVSPMRWDEVLGRPAPRDFAEDELIDV